MPQVSSRDKLLQAGLEAIHQSGYTATGVQQIADAAGVPKGSFYNHFATKEDFALAAIEVYWAGCSRFLSVLHDGERLPSPRRRLRAHFAAVASDVHSKGYVAGCLLCNLAAELSTHSEIIRARLGAIFARWTEEIATCLQAARDLGELPEGSDPSALAAFLMNSWQGALIRAKTDRREDAFREFDALVFGQLLRR